MLTNLDKHMERNIIVLGDYNMLFSPLDRSSRQKFRKALRSLPEILEALVLMVYAGLFILKILIILSSLSHTEHFLG